LFSATEIDFTDAIFNQTNVSIKIFSLFSSDTIYVPDNINVVSKAFCIFGSIDNDAPNNGISQISASTPVPTLNIEGVSIFSSIDIDLKRSMKEKLMNMADSFKRMFS
jgi:predicted membrane protein